MKKVTYIISDIDKALAFEWIAEFIDSSAITLDFILILKRPSVLEKFLRNKGISVQVFYYTSKASLIWLGIRTYIALIKRRTDIVHCHLLYGSLIGLTAAKLAGIKTRIYTRHHSDFHQRYFPSGMKWDKWCNALATRIIAPSVSVSEVLIQQEEVDPAIISIIHHGFDLDYFRNVGIDTKLEIKNKYNPDDQYPVIGVISRFTKWKGIQNIIPAFIDLLPGYPDALLLLFNAQGDYEQELRVLLKNIPEKNFKLIKFENEVSACYQLFDVFVHAPIDDHIEAFGQIYVEALAAGVPSVFTISGIAKDFIRDEENALIVGYQKSYEIHFAMLRLLEDSGLRKKLTDQGWNSVKERFALQHMIKQLEELYEKG